MFNNIIAFQLYIVNSFVLRGNIDSAVSECYNTLRRWETMEIMNIREDWNTLPDSSLRKLYRSLIKSQRRLAFFPVGCLFPAMLVYGFIGWVDFFVSEFYSFSTFDTTVTGIIGYFVFALCGVLMSAKRVKTLILTPLVMAVHILLKLVLFYKLTYDTIAMLCYLIAACAYTAKTVSDLNFLRSLPNFPFDGRDDRIKFEGLTRDEMVKNLEHAQTGGIFSTDYDKIFTSDKPEEIASPPEKKEEYMQSYKMNYDGLKGWKDYHGRD